jgi:phosphomannomutase
MFMNAKSSIVKVYRFGTSGYRHDADEAFNVEVVKQITHAIADALIQSMHAAHVAKPILVGGDTREKTKMAIPVIIEVLLAKGLDVYEVQGDVPTPILAYTAAHLDTLAGNGVGSAGAILMTASHNPWNYGGYNFLTAEGAVASSALSQQFEALQENPLNLTLNRDALGVDPTPRVFHILPYESYLEHLRDVIQIDVAALAEANLHVAYDPLYATGRYYFPKLLEDLGIEQVKVIHGEDERPEGYTGEPEPSAENLEALSQVIRQWQRQVPEALMVGFSNDGDADRFGVLDEKGQFLHPNTILRLIAYLMVHHRQAQGALVRSQATTHALDEMVKPYGIDVIQTPVGYKYIAEVFIEHDATPSQAPIILGGESSGGLSILHHIPEKDGLLANLLIAELIAKEKQPLSAIVEKVEALSPHHFIFTEWSIQTELKTQILNQAHSLFSEGGSLGPNLVVDVPRSQSEAQALTRVFHTQDGIKLYLSDGSWVLVRASGTEPLVRVYLEVQDADKIKLQRKQEDLEAFWTAYFENLGIAPESIKRKA